MNIDIKLHKNDLPDDLELGNVLAVDGEFMGLNVEEITMLNSVVFRKFRCVLFN